MGDVPSPDPARIAELTVQYGFATTNCQVVLARAYLDLISAINHKDVVYALRWMAAGRPKREKERMLKPLALAGGSR